MPEFDLQLRKFIFQDGDLVGLAHGEGAPTAFGVGLGLGAFAGRERSS
jgi:hypothetical protein